MLTESSTLYDQFCNSLKSLRACQDEAFPESLLPSFGATLDLACELIEEILAANGLENESYQQEQTIRNAASLRLLVDPAWLDMVKDREQDQVTDDLAARIFFTYLPLFEILKRRVDLELRENNGELTEEEFVAEINSLYTLPSNFIEKAEDKPQLLSEIITVCHKYGAKSVLFYGSYARGDYSYYSDVDVCIL